MHDYFRSVGSPFVNYYSCPLAEILYSFAKIVFCSGFLEVDGFFGSLFIVFHRLVVFFKNPYISKTMKDWKNHQKTTKKPNFLCQKGTNFQLSFFLLGAVIYCSFFDFTEKKTMQKNFRVTHQTPFNHVTLQGMLFYYCFLVTDVQTYIRTPCVKIMTTYTNGAR